MEPDSNGTSGEGSDSSPSKSSRASRSTRSRSRHSRSSSREGRLYPELEEVGLDGAELPENMERYRYQMTRRRQVDVGEDEVVISGEQRSRSRRMREDFEEREGKPRKTFNEYVREDDEKNQRGLKRQKTIDDFQFKPGRGQDKGNISPVFFKMAHFGFAITAILLVGWALYSNILGSDEDEAGLKDFSYKDARGVFENSIRKMGPKNELFPGQTQGTIIQMYSAVSSTLEDSTPRQPSCITLLSPSTISKNFPMCFAQKFGLLANSLYAMVHKGEDVEPFLIDQAYLRKNDVSTVRLELDEYFKKGKTVIVKDAEKLRDEDHLRLLHGLCDNTGAIDKRAAIIFLLPFDEKLCAVKGTCDRPAQLVYKVLDDAWKNVVGDDSRPAMIARVAASEVILKEDTCS